MKVTDLEATDSVKKKKAEAKLADRVRVGAAQQEAAIKTAVSTVIVDRIWYPKKMTFSLSMPNAIDLRVSYMDEGSSGQQLYAIHNHALGQMAGVIEVARAYVSKLREGPDWKKELLVHILNEHFQKESFETAKGKPIGYLRRAVGYQIRGFQGRSFGRSMATAPLLRSFVEECGRFRAGPIESHTSDVLLTLKCVLPYVFEPVPGEFVAFGISFSNSDFGAGKLSVGGSVLRISSGSISVTEDTLSKIHLGKILDSDEELTLSEETVNKELDAYKSAIVDVVRSVLAPESIERALNMIVLAHKHKIEWFRLRASLSKVLSKKEVDLVKSLLDNGDDLMDLPPVQTAKGEDRVATAWWASNVIGWFASKEEDVERRRSLQELAGEVLKP